MNNFCVEEDLCGRLQSRVLEEGSAIRGSPVPGPDKTNEEIQGTERVTGTKGITCFKFLRTHTLDTLNYPIVKVHDFFSLCSEIH